MSQPPSAPAMHASWVAALEPVAQRLQDLGAMLREENRAGVGYLPPGHQVLRAFQQPLDHVRVLVVGQDPYPTPGHAVGLSFSVAPQVRPLPRSLVNIFKELVDDVHCAPPTNGDLTPWEQQGVMLLNRVLTVSPGQAGSHQGRGWEVITQHAVQALVARDQPLVAVLWGAQAGSLRKVLGHTPIVASAHPSPLSAHRGFFGSRPFSAVNRLLVEQGAQPIDWSLTTAPQAPMTARTATQPAPA